MELNESTSDESLEHGLDSDDLELIEGNGGELSADPFKMFSKDLHGKDYKMRDPKTQAEWGVRKSTAQMQMALHLFSLKSPWLMLADACRAKCENKGESRLFTVIEIVDGKPALNHSKDLLLEVLEKITKGIESGDFSELSVEIVEHYNVSYHHFIKVAMARFDQDCYSKIRQSRMLRRRASEGCLESKQMIVVLGKDIEAVALREDVSVKELQMTARNLKTVQMSFNHYRDKLVETNLRQCISLAREHEKRANIGGIDITDLISEGSEGLIKAAEMFISGIGVKFTTYAEYWINLKISRYIKNTNPVRIPIHVTDQVYKITNFLQNYAKSHAVGELPSITEVSLELDLRISASIWQLAHNRYKSMPVSFSCSHTDVEEDGGVSFDLFSKTHSECEKELNDSILKEQIWKIAKDNLSSVEYEVILGHYKHDRSFKDISEFIGGKSDGKNVSITKNKALAKLARIVGEQYGK
jgi:RNA polymerase sigma factor (sigma-70 family)